MPDGPAEQKSSPPDAPVSKRALRLLIRGLGVVIFAALTALGVKLFQDATAPPPVRVEVQPNIDQISLGPATSGGEYWLPVSLAQLPSPPEALNTCMGRYTWAHEHGGVDAERTIARVVVFDNGTEPVAITGLRVHTLSRRPPPRSGVVVSCPGRGEGPAAVHIVDVNLDREPPRVESYPAGSLRPDPTFGFTLTPGQSQIFDLVATTKTCYCTWEVYLLVSAGGNPQEVEIGHPFVTTADSRTVAYYEEHRWLAMLSPP
jgi:hypothetical protein